MPVTISVSSCVSLACASMRAAPFSISSSRHCCGSGRLLGCCAALLLCRPEHTRRTREREPHWRPIAACPVPAHRTRAHAPHTCRHTLHAPHSPAHAPAHVRGSHAGDRSPRPHTCEGATPATDHAAPYAREPPRRPIVPPRTRGNHSGDRSYCYECARNPRRRPITCPHTHTHTRRGRGGGRETAFGFCRSVRIMRAPWQPGAPWPVCTRGAPGMGHCHSTGDDP